jgi:hypothetical protein
MKKVNIKDLSVEIEMQTILNNIKDENSLYIDIDSNIFFKKEKGLNKPVVFSNENLGSVKNIEDLKELSSVLFKDYKPQVVGTKCKLNPLMNWQNIIELNKYEMLYYDHQSDGVEIFEDETLEDIGWNASALEINYRQLADFIEENCDGTLLFYDNEIQFNGFCFVDSLEDARLKVKEFVIRTTKENLTKNILELEDDDVIEALDFFEIEVGK